MNNLYKYLTIFLLGTMLLSGCGGQELQGSWVIREFKPPEGQKYHNLAKVTFKKDMTFESIAVKDGEKTISKGTYKYDLFKKQLTLHTKGKELKYMALVWLGNELRITKKMPDGTKVTAYMDRPKTAKKCPTCGAVIE